MVEILNEWVSTEPTIDVEGVLLRVVCLILKEYGSFGRFRKVLAMTEIYPYIIAFLGAIVGIVLCALIFCLRLKQRDFSQINQNDRKNQIQPDDTQMPRGEDELKRNPL